MHVRARTDGLPRATLSPRQPRGPLAPDVPSTVRGEVCDRSSASHRGARARPARGRTRSLDASTASGTPDAVVGGENGLKGHICRPATGDGARGRARECPCGRRAAHARASGTRVCVRVPFVFWGPPHLRAAPHACGVTAGTRGRSRPCRPPGPEPCVCSVRVRAVCIECVVCVWYVCMWCVCRVCRVYACGMYVWYGGVWRV